ncbi:MAG: hypothetical protein KAJ14_05975 [Candidatus Omnitrophica bacterium]|nr:hypothetical protein [Candidatus Omnitrophota bacterium]
MFSRLHLNKKNLLFTFGLFFFISLPIFQIITASELNHNNNDYNELINIYKKWLTLDSEAFQILSFKLSSEQLIKKGAQIKLTLDDNFGRKWIFKPGYTGEKKCPYWDHSIKKEKAVIVYRIYKLFGLPNPRIHFVTLNINGKKISGNIQRFISNKGTLSKYSPSQISQKALSYILKTHILDWILINDNARTEHFIITSLDKTNKPEQLMRVDNSINSGFSKINTLSNSWACPPKDKICNTFYYFIWQDYTRNKINLDLKKNFRFINFVNEFPDIFLNKLLILMEIKNFSAVSDVEFDKFKQQNDFFLEPIFFKKHTLNKDFKKFYKGLAEKKGETFEPLENFNYQQIIKSISKGLNEEIKRFKEDKSKLNEAPSTSHKIKAIFCFEGFDHLANIYCSYWNNKKIDLIPKCGKALKELNLLKSQTKNKYEKKALKIYIKEIKRIMLGEPPSFGYSKINKIIGSVVPKH